MAVEAVASPIALLQPRAAAPIEGAEPLGESTEATSAFSQVLSNAVSEANATIQHGNAAGEAFAAGRSDDIHGTMIALSEADISLRVVSSVRNKVIDAFYELWRMNV